MVDSGRGAVLSGSRLGNLEMIRALAVNERQAAVNAVVYTDHAQRFNELLRQANADFGINLIQVSRLGPETAIVLKDKVDRGELVVIVGDRTPPAASDGGRVSQVEFLGEPAPFAQGPFILASLLDCPVYLCFCLREKRGNGHGYRIHLEHFAERIDLPRRDRLTRLPEYLQQYARRKEGPLRGVEVWLTHSRNYIKDCEGCDDPGRRIERITREFVLTGELSEEQKMRLKEIAQKCPVHKTLSHDLEIVDTDPELKGY